MAASRPRWPDARTAWEKLRQLTPKHKASRGARVMVSITSAFKAGPRPRVVGVPNTCTAGNEHTRRGISRQCLSRCSVAAAGETSRSGRIAAVTVHRTRLWPQAGGVLPCEGESEYLEMAERTPIKATSRIALPMLRCASSACFGDDLVLLGRAMENRM